MATSDLLNISGLMDDAKCFVQDGAAEREHEVQVLGAAQAQQVTPDIVH